ncbi:hypothetical protein VP01_346g4 [Puccinia sorghi]|uniref:Uncharacterized protein n=1 Tax=Puccinia sorghi TaxID=27349 RepID=A0A0L6UXW6_9BASI|nr:hypothetical protein VP01_346g4 [Puccinia sorghi]
MYITSHWTSCTAPQPSPLRPHSLIISDQTTSMPLAGECQPTNFYIKEYPNNLYGKMITTGKTEKDTQTCSSLFFIFFNCFLLATYLHYKLSLREAASWPSHTSLKLMFSCSNSSSNTYLMTPHTYYKPSIHLSQLHPKLLPALDLINKILNNMEKIQQWHGTSGQGASTPKYFTPQLTTGCSKTLLHNSFITYLCFSPCLLHQCCINHVVLCWNSPLRIQNPVKVDCKSDQSWISGECALNSYLYEHFFTYLLTGYNPNHDHNTNQELVKWLFAIGNGTGATNITTVSPLPFGTAIKDPSKHTVSNKIIATPLNTMVNDINNQCLSCTYDHGFTSNSINSMTVDDNAAQNHEAMPKGALHYVNFPVQGRVIYPGPIPKTCIILFSVTILWSGHLHVSLSQATSMYGLGVGIVAPDHEDKVETLNVANWQVIFLKSIGQQWQHKFSDPTITITPVITLDHEKHNPVQQILHNPKENFNLTFFFSISFPPLVGGLKIWFTPMRPQFDNLVHSVLTEYALKRSWNLDWHNLMCCTPENQEPNHKNIFQMMRVGHKFGLTVHKLGLNSHIRLRFGFGVKVLEWQNVLLLVFFILLSISIYYLFFFLVINARTWRGIQFLIRVKVNWANKYRSLIFDIQSLAENGSETLATMLIRRGSMKHHLRLARFSPCLEDS